MGSPFEVADTVSFQTLSTTGPKQYLNSSPGAAVHDLSISVYLTDVLDFKRTPGCFWKIINVGYAIRLQTESKSSNKRYLDSSSGQPDDRCVYMEDESAGRGSHWTTTICPADNTYTIKSHSPSGLKRYLIGNPTAIKKESVYLVIYDNEVGAHWRLVVSSYAGEKIERIIRAVYPSVPIDTYEADAVYGSMDYDRLHTIHDHGNYPAVQLKEKVSQVPNHYNLPDVRGYLCGIMSGTIGNESSTINFTIDQSVNLILFDPQNGQQIANDTFTPTSCRW